MMELIKMWPAVLIHRWGLTIAAGFGFLLVGVAVWMATQDRIMLLLSGTVFFSPLGGRLYCSGALYWAIILCLRGYVSRLLQMVIPVLGHMPGISVLDCGLSETRMYVKVTSERLKEDVVPGDTVQYGLIITNSEVGMGAMMALERKGRTAALLSRTVSVQMKIWANCPFELRGAKRRI